MAIKTKYLWPEKFSELEDHPFSDIQEDAVQEYMQKILQRRDEEVGYIVTVGENHGVVDGRHRAEAYKRLGFHAPVINISEEDYVDAVESIPIMSLEEIAESFRKQIRE